jgi:hypothetical protein
VSQTHTNKERNVASGRGMMLTKQIGEYLVACELARRGLVVATFSGNVPDFDIIAINAKGEAFPVQVKAIRGGSWQFSVDKFVEIKFDFDSEKQIVKQIVGKLKPQSIANLVCVFVIAGEKYGDDQFFVLEWKKVQEIAVNSYKSWLELHGNVRPKKHYSLHCAIRKSDLERYQDNWSVITKGVKTVESP